MTKRKSPATTKQSTGTGATAAQRRIAAQQAMARATGAEAAARRRRLLTVGSPIVIVALIAALLVAFHHTPKNKSGAAATDAGTSVSAEVTNVPLSVLNTVGIGSVTTPPTALSGTALTSGGVPSVLYVGAEWCPYCAAERWGLAVALSRFGTLTGLGQVRSSSTDVYPSTATLSFHGATYTSKYLDLTAKEIYSNQVNAAGQYEPLDTLTAAEKTLFTNVGKGSFPFIDIGGKYLISGASYNPSTLSGKSQKQIAAALSDPSSTIAKAVDGTANVITAAICATTSNAPSAVCTAPGVTAAAAALK